MCMHALALLLMPDVPGRTTAAAAAVASGQSMFHSHIRSQRGLHPSCLRPGDPGCIMHRCTSMPRCPLTRTPEQILMHQHTHAPIFRAFVPMYVLSVCDRNASGYFHTHTHTHTCRDHQSRVGVFACVVVRMLSPAVAFRAILLTSRIWMERVVKE